MFLFISICMDLIAYLEKHNTHMLTMGLDERAKAHKHVSDYYYQVFAPYCLSIDIKPLSLTQYRLFTYWQYMVEAAHAQAVATMCGKDILNSAHASVQANRWASRLGYEVVGV